VAKQAVEVVDQGYVIGVVRKREKRLKFNYAQISFLKE
jgi:hypothetical protein